MPRDRATGKKVARGCRGVDLWPPKAEEEEKKDVYVSLEYFSYQELAKIEKAMKLMQGVGISILSFWGEKNEQRSAFFGLAKLWRVVRIIISLVFIENLKDGRLKLLDLDGNEYGLHLTRQNGSVRTVDWDGILKEEGEGDDIY